MFPSPIVGSKTVLEEEDIAKIIYMFPSPIVGSKPKSEGFRRIEKSAFPSPIVGSKPLNLGESCYE